MGSCELEVSAVHADCGGISEVGKVPVYRQWRRTNRTNAIESDVANLADMLMSYLTDEFNTFSRDESADQR